MGKGEIAHYEQFLLFPQCLKKKKTCTADTIGQTFCFVNWVQIANWVQNKGSLSVLCIAPGMFQCSQ